jgi:hypothetical protein
MSDERRTNPPLSNPFMSYFLPRPPRVAERLGSSGWGKHDQKPRRDLKENTSRRKTNSVRYDEQAPPVASSPRRGIGT